MPLSAQLWSSPSTAGLTMLATPAEALGLELPDGASPVLETPVLPPIDLTDSHGVDFTLARLQEMVAAYNPAIEAASLNFDHAYGGPSHGWCERVWLLDDVFWCRYVDLSTEAVEGIRQRRWTRRSGEFIVNHPVTNTFYFTGLALLGKARPAVPGLPPLHLHHRPFFFLTGAEPQKEHPNMAVKPQQETPAPATTPAPTTPAAAAGEAAVQLSAAEVSELRAGVALVANLRMENAALQADKAIQKLGARVTPAMRRTLHPLLVQLMGQEAQQTIKLSQPGDGATAVEMSVVDAVLQVLSAVPPFEALNRGPIADDDGSTEDNRSADEVALHTRHGITSERAAEIRSRYQEGN